jgi:hypothetical protein
MLESEIMNKTLKNIHVSELEGWICIQFITVAVFMFQFLSGPFQLQKLLKLSVP